MAQPQVCCHHWGGSSWPYGPCPSSSRELDAEVQYCCWFWFHAKPTWYWRPFDAISKNSEQNKTWSHFLLSKHARSINAQSVTKGDMELRSPDLDDSNEDLAGTPGKNASDASQRTWTFEMSHMYSPCSGHDQVQFCSQVERALQEKAFSRTVLRSVAGSI